MKNTRKLTFLACITIASIAVVSCNTNETPEIPAPNISLIQDDIVISQSFEDLDNLTLKVLGNSGLAARSEVSLPSGDICPNAEVTMDKVNKKITVDFKEGCTSDDGTVRKGKLVITYNGNLLFPGAKIVTSFEGYEVDGHKIEGTRTLTNKGVDLNANSIDLEIKIDNAKVTWPDKTFVTFTSNQSRTLILGPEGYEASATGTASGVSREGSNFTTIVTDPLMVNQTCIISGITVPSSGILIYKYDNKEVSLDYGDGTCDKSILVSYPGGSKELIVD